MKIKVLYLLLTIMVLGLLASPIFAQTITENMRNVINNPGVLSLPSIGTDLEGGAQTIIGKVINAFIGLFGAFFLILVIYGGFKWMNAKGNQEEMEKAKKILQSAIIGFIIVMLAYAISFFVAYALQKAATVT